MKQFGSLFYVLSVLFLIFLGCSEKIEKIPHFLTIDQKTLSFSADASVRDVPVKTSLDEWSATVESATSSWLSAGRQGSNLRISLTENNNQDVRKGNIVVNAGSLSETIEVEQLGLAPAILLAESVFNVDAEGEMIELLVTSNIEYDIIIPEEAAWIVHKKDDNTRAGMVTLSHHYEVKWNMGTEVRSAEIKVKHRGGTLEEKVSVTQKERGEYSGNSNNDIKDDFKVKVSGGQASSYQQGEGIEKSFDGDLSTIYHSSWDNTSDDYFPITLDYFFEQEERIDYLVYHPRTEGHNGHFKETEIWVKSKNHPTLTKVADFDFRGNNSATRVTFDEPLMEPETVRFVVKSGAGDGQGFASCAEMEFYKTNPDNVNLLDIFTDMSATALNPDVTPNDIEQIPNTLYRNIAWYMYQNSYPHEFRIAEYRAYPHPGDRALENKTSRLSLLDNPTGIRVDSGDELVVFVDETHNYPLSIRIQNLDKPGGDGYNDASTYPLAKGVNKIRAGNKGLIYVMYHTPDYTSAPAVKIHFATGEVNGYFDSQQHDAADWRNYLESATDKYFDLLGEHAHITFPTELFKQNTPDGKALIEAYDELVFMEKEFMGLIKYNRPTINRNYFHAMYDSFMYSTWYRTAYNINYEDVALLMTDVNKFRQDSWGPAHEVGHTFQTSPGFKWHGMTEVTNNVHSMYVESQWSEESRLEAENVSPYNTRYEKAYHSSFVKGVAHAKEEDVFCKLVSLWQLQLYFSNVKGEEDTYKDLYEMVRTSPDKPTAGEQQLEFVKMMCEITSSNLVPFFEKWGYLTPVDIVIDDYGEAAIKITQNQIDQLVSFIESKGYSEITEPLEYISDSNWKLFRDRLAIQSGSASASGSKITMNGWENVIAYEVYEGDDLVFVSNQNSFELENSVTPATKVYAVAFNGSRVEVGF